MVYSEKVAQRNKKLLTYGIPLIIIVTFLIIAFSGNLNFSSGKLQDNPPFEIKELYLDNCQIWSDGVKCNINLKAFIPKVMEYGDIDWVYLFYTDYTPDKNQFNYDTKLPINLFQTGETVATRYSTEVNIDSDNGNVFLCWTKESYEGENRIIKDYKCLQQLVKNPKYGLAIEPSVASVDVERYGKTDLSFKIKNKGTTEICPQFVYDLQDYSPTLSISPSYQCISAGDSKDYIATIYSGGQDAFSQSISLRVYYNSVHYADFEGKDISDRGHTGLTPKQYEIKVNIKEKG